MADIHKSGNWSFVEPPFKDGDVVEGGNYSQLLPDTEICKTVKRLTIMGGNFTNCKLQPGWKVTGGNWTQIDRCSHLHPEWIERGLPKCRANCMHRSPSPDTAELDEPEVSRRMRKSEPLPGLSSEIVVDKYGIDQIRRTVQEYVYRETARG